MRTISTAMALAMLLSACRLSEPMTPFAAADHCVSREAGRLAAGPIENDMAYSHQIVAACATQIREALLDDRGDFATDPSIVVPANEGEWVTHSFARLQYARSRR